MPSSASNARPTRWDYAPAELGELPAELRPTHDQPPPASTPCPELGCSALVQARWIPPRLTGHPSLGAGRWNPGHLCPVCKAAEDHAIYLRQVAELVESSGMPPRYAWADFGRHVKQGPSEPWPTFRDRLDAANEDTRAAGPHLGITAWNVRAAQTVREWRPGPGAAPPTQVIYLTGPVGSGKTTLAAASAMGTIRTLAQATEPSHYTVRWISSGELWESLRVESSTKGRRGALAKWASADVLVLDDLGTLEVVKPWNRDAMEFLVCSRYNASRPTLITSNLRLDSTDEKEPTIATLYGERVVSRLVEGMGGRRRGPPPGYLELLGMDWRADVPHPTPDPSRPVSPAATAATTGRQEAFDWAERAAGAHLED